MSVERLNPLAEGAATPQVASKRLLDVVVSSIALVVLAPVFALVALAIRLDDGGSVIFRQTRIGRWEKPFRIYKFRSMRPARSTTCDLTIGADPRLTRIGGFLRDSKLDELPQLFNVLKGDMSLVGPRAETPELAAHYDRVQRTIFFSVRPGVTDHASALLRDESALLATRKDPVRFYRERLMRFKYEACVQYVGEIGVWTDLRIILATAWSIAFSAEGNPLVDKGLAARLEEFCRADESVTEG